MNLKDSALGSIVRLNYPENHQLVFEAGRPVRYDLGEGFAAVTGEVEFADGSHAWAVPASAQIMTTYASSTSPGFARLVSS